MSPCRHEIIGACPKCEREAYHAAVRPALAAIESVRRRAVAFTEPTTAYDGDGPLYIVAHLAAENAAARSAIELVLQHLRAEIMRGEP